ncbi:GNAT family N-acetyltransferase [Roseobacter sp. S98]|uniref:GNAT family N-acetyltransferase n=1 Tax=Roseobacter algicola (ex Choi et al. 2025) (nom. illeg.) TaxID=3092138 RepID=UPI0035C73232
MREPQVGQIDGVRLTLRLARPVDAEFVFGLRSDIRYNRYLSSVSGTVQDQTEWLQNYCEREAAGEEFYYIILRRDTGRPCGVVRLYEIAGDQFTWGSWVLNNDKPPKAALESAVLSYEIAFEGLGLVTSYFDARLGNSRAISFYRRFGAIEIARDERDVFFKYTAKQFAMDKNRHMKLLQEKGPDR